MGTNSDMGRDDRKAKAEIRKRAEGLMREAGLPANLAHQVAAGTLTLNEVLERMARRDKVDSLMRRYELPKSLATQIALGQAELEAVLFKRRMTAHLTQWRDHASLANAVTDGGKIALGLHGSRIVTGVVASIDQYEFDLQVGEEPVETVHKLQAKWTCAADDLMAVRKGMTWDKDRKGDAEPVPRPQDRYGCSDRRLFGLLDTAADAVATTLEGEVFRGTVVWLGRWEFAMKLRKKGAIVVLFRHALADLREH